MPETEKATISDAAPAPLRSRDTFPTPQEIAETEITGGEIEYIEATDGVSPINVQSYVDWVGRQPMRAIRTLMTARANAYELQHGLELRWLPDYVRGMTASEIRTYLTAVMSVLGARQAAGAAPEEGRPMVTPEAPLPKAKTAGRQRRPRSTGPSSQIGSITNTDGPPSSSVA